MNNIKEQALISIYENWKGKSRLELSKNPHLVLLSDEFPSLAYYIEHQLLSWPYDAVDVEDLRGLEYHIELYCLEM